MFHFFHAFSVGKKVLFGFLVVLLLLIFSGVLSFLGISGIVFNAGQVINGNKLDGMLAQKEVDHLNWVGELQEVFIDPSLTSLSLQTDNHKCGFGQWLYSPQRKELEAEIPSLASSLKAIEPAHKALHDSAKAINAILADDKDKVKIKAVFVQQTKPSLKKVQSLLRDIRTEAKGQIIADTAMLEAANSTKIKMLSFVGGIVLVGIALAIIIAKSITGPIYRIMGELSGAASETSSASGQIASASQVLATGVSSQAASIEETSSTMEEISSMTRQNAENTAKANTIMRDTSQAIILAGKFMKELNVSMEEITTASEETSKIIKTIDEIAFQTNLLALNAAVEAARAGEAGAGFAVVADEVRNLAMRAASAAKDTAGLIDDTMDKVTNGKQIVVKTNESFQAVESNSGEISSLISEISVASAEQSDGITQVSSTISTMEKVTQQNASTAEECAAASEEMTAQAQSLLDISASLEDVVKGKS